MESHPGPVGAVALQQPLHVPRELVGDGRVAADAVAQSAHDGVLHPGGERQPSLPEPMKSAIRRQVLRLGLAHRPPPPSTLSIAVAAVR